MSKEQRLNLYKKFISESTKIVGFAPFLMPAQFEGFGQKLNLGIDTAMSIIDEVKENFPWVKIVVGGQTARWFMNLGHKHSSTKVDAVFIDEGEHSFLEYCEYVFNNNSHPPFTLINSLKVIRPAKQYDMSTCGMQFEKQDFILPGESLPIEFGRGCIFKCKFCQYPNIGKDKDDFNKPIEKIKESLIYNYENFSITRYHVTDDTLNAHRVRTQEFHKMVKTLPFRIEYLGYVRLDLIDIWPEQKDILPESGLISSHFGIESFDPESCKIIGKGWGAKNHKLWLEKISDYWKDDVLINCSLIAGLGNETPKEWEETFSWFKQSKIHDYFYQPLNLSYLLKVSEFERNASNYGYSWADPVNDPWGWTNKSTNYHETVEWCKTKVTIEQLKRRIPSVWNFASLRNQGFTKEEILASNYIDLHSVRKKEQRHEKFIEAYYKLAMSF
jgi:radical SAM superfamily enzyme YgiQ (UPF0313 family)